MSTLNVGELMALPREELVRQVVALTANVTAAETTRQENLKLQEDIANLGTQLTERTAEYSIEMTLRNNWQSYASQAEHALGTLRDHWWVRLGMSLRFL